jgi:hypothetical protein
MTGGSHLSSSRAAGAALGRLGQAGEKGRGGVKLGLASFGPGSGLVLFSFFFFSDFSFNSKLIQI